MSNSSHLLSRREFFMRSAFALTMLPTGSLLTSFAGNALAGQKINPASGFCSPADWGNAYETRWGALGVQSLEQIEQVIHAANGIYDDREGVFAWIVHYWLRAWVKMADQSGDTKYLDTAVSFINYMFEHTDAARIERGEIREDYLRDPAGLQGTGRGGPFWKRGREANVLNTGQIAHGILRFVDTVLENRDRWPAYAILAEHYFEQAKCAIDAFDADWKDFGEAGCYFYRDSSGSNVLGTTQSAFNQSATAGSAHILLNKWQPDVKRRGKVRRLSRYWLDEFAQLQADGTIIWPYIIHKELQHVEDAGHASMDLDFLTLAYQSGYSGITDSHIKALARTFKQRVWNSDATLNTYVDGSTDNGYDEHFNAGFGWLALAGNDPEIRAMALKTYERFYPANSPGGVLWARPMLGWANLLADGSICRA